jgi:ABC-2 type transport system permease protein
MRVAAIIRRIFQQIHRDRRTMALIFIAPLFVLTLMYFIFNGDTVNSRVGIVNIDQSVYNALQDADIDVVTLVSVDKDMIVQKGLDGILGKTDDAYNLILENSNPNTAMALKAKITQTISGVMFQTFLNEIPMGSLGYQAVDIDIDYLYGSEDTTMFDTFSSILIGFFVFFFVFLIAGIGLLRERMTGTMEKLMSTPVKRWEVVMGYLTGYGILAMVQTLVIIFFSVEVLNIVLVGSIWNVILICILSAITALALGILLSAFATSEFQMIQFIPIVIIPQVFFCGLFPMEGMAAWLQAVGKIMPMYYAADALKGVMYKGLGFYDILFDLGILAAFAVVFIVLNVFALKRYRRL